MPSERPPALLLLPDSADERTCRQNEKHVDYIGALSLRRQTHRLRAPGAPTPSLSPVRNRATGSAPHRIQDVLDGECNLTEPATPLASDEPAFASGLLNFGLAVVVSLRLKLVWLVFG